MFDYEDQGYAVLLSSPSGDTVLLQGDDYEQFLNEIETAEEAWEATEAFPMFGQLQDAIISAYF
jgi:hypothetical protein